MHYFGLHLFCVEDWCHPHRAISVCRYAETGRAVATAAAITAAEWRSVTVIWVLHGQRTTDYPEWQRPAAICPPRIHRNSWWAAMPKVWLHRWTLAPPSTIAGRIREAHASTMACDRLRIANGSPWLCCVSSIWSTIWIDSQLPVSDGFLFLFFFSYTLTFSETWRVRC